MQLPALREELSLLPGPIRSDGQPTWTLHDPARNRFFSIDWLSCEVLRHWSLAEPAAIIEAITTRTALQPQLSDVEHVTRFLAENQLLQPRGADSAREMAARLLKRQRSRLKWLLHHYLFFRIPLVKPDAWLERGKSFADLFYSRKFLLLTLVVCGIGIVEVARHWNQFLASLVDHFTWEGLAAYGAALLGVKFLHELGHAFTAKRYGCRVPTMGIAFLVMWPMAYTDTNESWFLTSRWQRLHVAAAGIVTELVIAAWATVAWAFLPDGTLRSTAFVLATSSWAASLAINASPFMRFDGYFILSDWVNIPNLHERSFALARWRLREWLFDLKEDRPEHFPPRVEQALILFAVLVWIYRLVLYLGIALLVYHFFIKAVGIFLFVVEMIWFVLLPVTHELGAWRSRWPEIRRTRRTRISALLLLAVMILACLPWPGRVGSSGTLRPSGYLQIYAPGPARVVQFDLDDGASVAAGDTLITLSAPQLLARQSGLVARVEQLRWTAGTAGFEAESRSRIQSMRDELATAEAELVAVNEELAKYSIIAPFAGHLRDIAPDIHVGGWVEEREKIALLVSPGDQIVETYLDEDAVKRIHVGNRGWFMIDAGSGPVLALTVTSIDADASRILNDGSLAASAGGRILTRDRNGVKVPESSVYRVVLHVDTPSPALSERSWRGPVTIHADREAPIWRYARHAMAVLVRETGF